MPQILPFKGIYYNQKKVGDVRKVISPPYDEIHTKEQHKMYLSRSKYNIIHLDKGEEKEDDHQGYNRYLRAAQSYQLWKKDGIFQQYLKDSYYYLKIEYTHKKEIYQRFGFLGILNLTPFSQNQIFPHEGTFPKPKQDRLSLLESCGVNFSPIFTLYADEKRYITNILQKQTEGQMPLIEVIDDDEVKYTVWSVDNPSVLPVIEDYMVSKDIIIADGHHRYETSLYFSQVVKEKLGENYKNYKFPSFNYILTYFTNIEEPHITIFPTHRLIRLPDISYELILNEIKKYFDIDIINLKDFASPSLENILKKMEEAGRERQTLGMYLGNREFYLLSLKKGINLNRVMPRDKPEVWKKLYVNLMQDLVLGHILGLKYCKDILDENIYYTKNPQMAVKLVKEGKYQIAFFLNPPDVHTIREIALLGMRLPQKSTYFYPKLPSGLIMYEVKTLDIKGGSCL